VVSNDALDAFEGESETLVIFDKLRTVGAENAINGSFAFTGDMDNDGWKVSCELYSSPESDGNYKRIVFDVPPTNICDFFKKFYVQFVQGSVQEGDITNFPLVDDNSCPIPQGEFFIKTLIFNTNDWPDQVPRGLVKAIVTFFKEGTSVGGLIAVVRIEDRKS